MEQKTNKTKNLHFQQEDSGKICITLGKQVYSAGERVQGVVHLNLHKPFPGHTLLLKLTGHEKVYWTSGNYSDGNTLPAEESPTTAPKVIAEDAVTILKGGVQIRLVHHSESIAKGSYACPFSFDLPDSLPGTFFCHKRNAFAEIKYFIRATLVSLHGDVSSIEVRRRLVVKEKSETNKRSINQDLNLVGCLGSNSGSIRIDICPEKKSYSPGEAMKIHVEIDTSRAKTGLKNIRLQLVHMLTLKTSEKTLQQNQIIAVRELGSVRKGESRTGEQSLVTSISLPEDLQDSSPIDYLALTEPVQTIICPSVHSKFIKSEFILELTCEASGFFSKFSNGPEKKRVFVQITPEPLPSSDHCEPTLESAHLTLNEVNFQVETPYAKGRGATDSGNLSDHKRSSQFLINQSEFGALDEAAYNSKKHIESIKSIRTLHC